jgi:hypothetical protein
VPVASREAEWDDARIMTTQEPGAPSAQELLATLQKLADKPADAGHPIEWAVPAHYLGDMTALAMLSLRSPA